MQQQHLMQMNQSMMGGYASSTTVTTDLIQQYLDENKQLILAILDNQNNGKVEECARNQAKLQQNLMYLAAIADSQPPQTASLSQYPSNLMMQSGPRYMPQQSAQMMSPQSAQMMAARSSMMYAQQAMSPLQQQQQQQQQHQAAAHGQLGMSSGATTGFNLLHGEASMGGGGTGNSMMNPSVFSDYGRGGAKEGSTSLSADARGANSGAHSGDGEYLKGTDEEGS
ncbi:GRF-interacting factor 1 isoform X2 [Hordeum vulgare subsp. vulgare]|uniref:SS18 N-terminal domain-containing protein n=1 Tax=Hordeum vulgare subsp. vulgare TaxID=112509 RepID=A0A8I6XCC0_HORVV|nr:GRF-interacting factor 1 isoform X2 [Hordeum vulgare subsp. vulgare]